MEVIKEQEVRGGKRSSEVKKISIISAIIIILIVVGYYVTIENTTLFQISIKIINIVLVYNIFLTTINFYISTKSSRMMVLGITYGIIGILIFFDILIHKRINMLTINHSDFYFTIFTLPTIIESVIITFILFIIVKTVDRCMSNIFFYTLFAINILVLLSLSIIFKHLKVDIFSSFIRYSIGIVIICTILYSIYLLTKLEEKTTIPVFTYITAYLVLSLLSQLSFIYYIKGYSLPYVLGNVLKTVSFYFMLNVVNEINRNNYFKKLCDLNENLKVTINRYKNKNTRLRQDIINKERNAQEILDDRKVLNSILESIEEGIIVVSINSEKKILHWNKKFLDMWDISENDITENNGGNIIEIIKDKVKNKNKFCEKCKELIESEDRIYDLLCLKNNKIFERNINPLKINKKVVGEVVCFRDITDQKRAEEEIKLSERRNRKLVEALPDAVVIHENFKIIFGNKQFLKLVGVEKLKDIMWKNLLEFVPMKYESQVIQSCEEILKNKNLKKVYEMQMKSVQGKLKEVEASLARIDFVGRKRVITIIRDITERKRVEKENQLNKELLIKERNYDEMKTQFFTNLSHELKTPINVLLGTVQLLDVYLANDTIHEEKNQVSRKIFFMKQNCYRLLRLINNLTDIVKIESGFLETEFKNHNIVYIVEEITLSVVEYVESKGIKLIFDTNIEEIIIACDPDMIERIMLNLLSNAIKFTEYGGRIAVKVYVSQDKVNIIVKDTGIGINKDKQKDIFERFKKVNETLVKNYQGTGIGLSLVKSLVEVHDGEINLESNYGEGSEFNITLPIKVADEEQVKEYHTELTSNIEKLNIEFSDIYSYRNTN